MSKHMREVANLASVPDAPPEIRGLLIAASVLIKQGQEARTAGRWAEAAELALAEYGIFAECVKLRDAVGPYRVNGLLDGGGPDTSDNAGDYGVLGLWAIGSAKKLWAFTRRKVFNLGD